MSNTLEQALKGKEGITDRDLVEELLTGQWNLLEGRQRYS